MYARSRDAFLPTSLKAQLSFLKFFEIRKWKRLKERSAGTWQIEGKPPAWIGYDIYFSLILLFILCFSCLCELWGGQICETAPEAEFLDVIGTKVLSKSGLKLVCNVKVVYGNHKSENFQDYTQKPQRNCTFMNSASALHVSTQYERQKPAKNIHACPLQTTYIYISM